ncbi:MAG: PorV/PorQ family protein [Candidatus Neomarinimicrobiota bacterium]
MKRNILLIIILLPMSLSFLFAQDKVGTAAAQFLQIPIGGKAIAMGGAFTALADDPTALYWNPGAIARTTKNKIYASQTNWLVGSKHQWIAAQFMITDQDVVGVCFNNLDYGQREKVTTVAEPDGTGEFWEASDMAFTISYARDLTDRFSIGGSVKYIQQKIWHESSNQFALDLGLLFITQFNGLRIGATMRNFGGELMMQGRDLMNRIDLDPESTGNNETIVSYLKTEQWPIPLTFSVGIAMPVIKNNLYQLTLAGDVIRPTDNSQTLNCGAEMLLIKILSIRAGYQSLFREDKQQGLTLGLGLKVPIPSADVAVDISYQDYGMFGNIQTTSISIGF